jgi:hypothetical protein
MAVNFEMDFAPLGKLGEIYRQNQERQALQQGLQQMGLPGNMSLAQLALQQQAVQRGEARDTRDFGFQKSQAAQQQQNADRTFGFQKQQAEAAARGFEIKEIDDGAGGKRLVRVERATGRTAALPIEGDTSGGQPQNPFAMGKMTDEQSKAGLYSSRMFNAEKILRDPDVVTAATHPGQHMVGRAASGGGVTGMIANNFLGPSYQKYDQAKRDFVNAVLRRESGAVISDSEFTNAEKQYFPQPGDTEDRIKQKQANRAEAIRGIATGAGPGYRPENTFDPEGNIIPNPAPKRGVAPQTAKLPTIASPADAAKLPKGTRFLDPNGVERVVP